MSPFADELELSVVLVNYNGADCLPDALRALAANTASDSVEGIVVDSGSMDASWEAVPEWTAHGRSARRERRLLHRLQPRS